MKEGIFPTAKRTPLSKPATNPIKIAGIIAATLRLEELAAATMAAKAVIDPTERSMEPEMITKVIPTATTNNTTVCWRTIKKLFRVRKRDDVKLKTVTKTASKRIGKSHRIEENLRGGESTSGT